MTGTVSGPDGPIAEARVELRRFGRVAAVSTDAEGSFRIAGLDDAEPYRQQAKATCPRTNQALCGAIEVWGFESPTVRTARR